MQALTVISRKCTELDSTTLHFNMESRSNYFPFSVPSSMEKLQSPELRRKSAFFSFFLVCFFLPLQVLCLCVACILNTKVWINSRS